MSEVKRIDRRKFLKGAVGMGAGAALFHVVPASALGRGARRPAPSNRIVMGCIGLGGQGSGNMGAFLGQPDTQVVAVCDVDKSHLAGAKKTVDQRYDNSDCTAYARLPRPARPQRSGRYLAGDARPLARHRRHRRAERGHGRVRRKADLALPDGRPGDGRRAEEKRAHLADGQLAALAEPFPPRLRTGAQRTHRQGHPHRSRPAGGGGIGPVTFKDPPPELDYDFWVGPSRWQPYCDQRTHWNWRWQLDYGGGQLMDWIGHHADIANWGMGWDSTGPMEVEGKGEYPTEGIWNAATTYHFVAKYKGGVEMHVANGGNAGIRSGTNGSAKTATGSGWTAAA